MEEYLTTLILNRKELLKVIAQLNIDQLNLVPSGNSNNIVWNLGHLLIVSENLLYKHSPLERPAHEFDLSQFARNTRPEQFVSKDDVLLIKKDLLETADNFMEIHNSSRLKEIDIEIEKIISEDELRFILFHENIHYQTIMKFMYLVSKNSYNTPTPL
jgi:hypothetical protein